jgi:hypothetical protein
MRRSIAVPARGALSATVPCHGQPARFRPCGVVDPDTGRLPVHAAQMSIESTSILRSKTSGSGISAYAAPSTANRTASGADCRRKAASRGPTWLVKRSAHCVAWGTAPARAHYLCDRAARLAGQARQGGAVIRDLRTTAVLSRSRPLWVGWAVSTPRQ